MEETEETKDQEIDWPAKSDEETITEMEESLQDWIKCRQTTIATLRDIAAYIEQVTKKSTIAKAIGSGTGVVAGGLTLVGGALTIATGGLAAVPVLIAGTSIGLAAGVTGGTAAIAERIIKSRQMKEAKKALESDQTCTKHLQDQLTEVMTNEKVKRKIGKDLVITCGSAAKESLQLSKLLVASSSGLISQGLQTTAEIFGDDVAKHVSKVILVASSRVVTGTLSIVTGGITMAYDIYKLSNEIESLAKAGEHNVLTEIATKLEEALEEIIL